MVVWRLRRIMSVRIVFGCICDDSKLELRGGTPGASNGLHAANVFLSYSTMVRLQFQCKTQGYEVHEPNAPQPALALCTRLAPLPGVPVAFQKQWEH